MTLTTAQAAILAVLGALSRRAHRTQLVKLVYMCDYRFHSLTGRTLTGFSYAWDNCGPNAVGNAVVRESERLVALNRVRCLERPSLAGGQEYLYWTDEDSYGEALKHLSPGELQVVQEVVKQFGRLQLRQLVAESKATKPFEVARQYQVLQLEQDQNTRQRREQVIRNSSFMERARKGLQEALNGNLVEDSEIDRYLKEKR